MGTIKISHYKIRISDPQARPVQPYSMVLLADLHNAVFGVHNEELLQAIRGADPKAVLVAGDMIVAKGRRWAADASVELLGELTRRYPVFYANGNHEDRLDRNREIFGDTYDEYVQEIRSLGVHLLLNARLPMEINRMKTTIYGYRPEWRFYRHGRTPQMRAEDIKAVLGEANKNTFNILLAHHPDYFQAYADWGADLVLSGHLHGGMIRLPGVGGVISPGWRLFPRYDHGLYMMRDKKMIVSAGLASHTIKLRVNNPPELVVIDIL